MRRKREGMAMESFVIKVVGVKSRNRFCLYATDFILLIVLQVTLTFLFGIIFSSLTRALLRLVVACMPA